MKKIVNFSMAALVAMGAILAGCSKNELAEPEVKATIEITATDGTKNYTKTVTGKTWAANNFYQQGLLMTEVAGVTP